MAQHISPEDARITWKGTVSTEVKNGEVMPWRIPFPEKDLFAWQLVERAAMPAGVRIEFTSNTPHLELFFDSVSERSPIDVFCDGDFKATLETADLNSAMLGTLGTKNKAIQIWLPQYGEFRLNKLIIEDNASLTKLNDDKHTKWVTYGSSITQCRDANSPSRTWPSIVARKHNLDLTCLGYAGQCHLDPMVARTIRDIPADIISMCLGINVYTSSSLGERTFQPGIMGIIKILREKHVTTPLILMSPIYSPGREKKPNDVGLTLEYIRNEIKEAVEIMQTSGDQNIYYLDGLTVFDNQYENLLPDNLHPNDEGYSIMAGNISNFLKLHL